MQYSDGGSQGPLSESIIMFPYGGHNTIFSIWRRFVVIIVMLDPSFNLHICGSGLGVYFWGGGHLQPCG